MIALYFLDVYCSEQGNNKMAGTQIKGVVSLLEVQLQPP